MCRAAAAARGASSQAGELMSLFVKVSSLGLSKVIFVDGPMGETMIVWDDGGFVVFEKQIQVFVGLLVKKQELKGGPDQR